MAISLDVKDIKQMEQIMFVGAWVADDLTHSPERLDLANINFPVTHLQVRLFYQYAAAAAPGFCYYLQVIVNGKRYLGQLANSVYDKLDLVIPIGIEKIVGNSIEFSFLQNDQTIANLNGSYALELTFFNLNK